MSFGWDDVASFGGAAIGAAANFFGQSSANAANLKSAREQMAFQERMSNTSWQRGIQDMRRAGINPMLAVSKGGASVPPGASSVSQSTTDKAVTSAQSAIRLKADLDNLRASNEQIKSAAALNLANTANAIQMTRKTKADADISEAEASAIGLGLRFGKSALQSAHSASSLFDLLRNPKLSTTIPQSMRGKWGKVNWKDHIK